MTMNEGFFSELSDDIVLNIFFKLGDDPRRWARLACVCTKFSSLIRHTCWKVKCSQTIPFVVSDLLSTPTSSSSSAAAAAPPGGWAALHKLAICCPGLLHAGVSLNKPNELDQDENYPENRLLRSPACESKLRLSGTEGNSCAAVSSSELSLSFLDDLCSDTVHDAPEFRDRSEMGEDHGNGVSKRSCKRRRLLKSMRSHLASGVWNLSREQGNKLLASRFRGDCLYICDWPGCVHIEKKRNYMLFRGVFKNFKLSRVWKTISDGDRSKIDVNCAFCSCKQIWNLHSAFCLRRVFGYHEDGEPVVRAYVCENGHVSGAWTDWPLYT
ncbi:hypothetical protein NMG60_11013833 [Bertholletia excelsa]